VVQQVAHRLAELARRRFTALVDFRPCNEFVEHGLTPRLTRSELGVRIAIANLVLDLIELLVRGEWQRRARIACLQRFDTLRSSKLKAARAWALTESSRCSRSGLRIPQLPALLCPATYLKSPT